MSLENFGLLALVLYSSLLQGFIFIFFSVILKISEAKSNQDIFFSDEFDK
jgi:hypothetical protein